MKTWIGTALMSLLLSAALWAQATPGANVAREAVAASRVHGPTYSEMYCSGFITRKSISRSAYVLGSKESPHMDRLQDRSMLFLRGRGLTVGERYSIVRQVADPNREDSSPQQRQKLHSLGALYQDVGWVTVRSVFNGTAVASFDFACIAAVPGDLVVPFRERPQIAFHKSEAALPTFIGEQAKPHGQILGGRDFDSLFGDGSIVYTNFGADKGAKPGDYLMVTRGYAPGDLNEVDRASDYLPSGAEVSSVDPARLPADAGALMPLHVLGQMIVLNVSQKSSTALVITSRAAMELGDAVQAEGGEEQAMQ